MHSSALGRRRDVHGQVVRQRVDQRVEALHGGAQGGGVGGVHAAGRDALLGELVESLLIAVERDDFVVAGFTQHMSNGVTDQTCANDGYVHMLLLVLCMLFPASNVRCAWRCARWAEPCDTVYGEAKTVYRRKVLRYDQLFRRYDEERRQIDEIA
jgi:hypothetical protein